MPQPYAKAHHTFLRRYLESARSNLLNRVKSMFAQHKNGFLIEVCHHHHHHPLLLFCHIHASKESDDAYITTSSFFCMFPSLRFSAGDSDGA
jgi:hypothetical protein